MPNHIPKSTNSVQTASLTMDIDPEYRLWVITRSTESRVKKINFIFYPDIDTLDSLAAEMVDQLKWADHDVVFIIELIDDLIRLIIPNWKPSSDKASDGQNVASDANFKSRRCNPALIGSSHLTSCQRTFS
ncbi:putative serine/threonine-protein kinase WNK7, partial [Drosera capensis]